MRGLPRCVGALFVALLVPLCISTASASEKIPVVATFTIVGDMVRNVGGERVSVTTLVGPGGDAHVFHPTPADAAAIKRAKVVFENGLGFEGWMERLINSSGYTGPRVALSEKITPLYRETDHDHGHHHGHHHRESLGAMDPHAWQSLANGVIYVEAIKAGLCAADVAGCPIYEKNAASYIAKLRSLDEETNARFASVPESKRKLITSHDAFSYFADRYNLEVLSPEGKTTEMEASAQDVAKLIRQIRKHNIVALFVENVSDPRLLEQIARETGLKPSGRLYSDALSAAGGPADTYLSMMRHNAFVVADALESGS